MINRIGYACINMSLKPQKFRSLRLKTAHGKGVGYLREVYLHNLHFVEKILRWNEDQGIGFYRLPSDLLPLATHEELLRSFDWRWHEDPGLLSVFARIRNFVEDKGMRISMHPDQFTVLNSPRGNVVENSRENLFYHSRIMDLAGGSDILIHVGGVYGDKKSAITRFSEAYKTLPESIKRYLRLENDDVSYTASDVAEIYEETGIPLVFDYHHDRCNPSEGASREEILPVFMGSWKPTGLLPKVHLSSGRNHPLDRSHGDEVSIGDFEDLDRLLKDWTFDLMLEAKNKELAVLKLRETRMRKG